MPPIPQIVTALRTSRAAFGTVFEQAQMGLPPNRRVLFDALAVLPTDAENFTKALEHARDNGYLSGLLDWLIDQNLEDGTLVLAAADALPQPESGGDTLQSMVSEVRGFTQPDALYRGVLSGMRWSVKITVQTLTQRSNGTGVLIAPHLVITAWHVVQSLFTQHAGIWTPDLLGSNQLTVEFDDYLRFVRPNRPPRPAGTEQISAANDWCVAFSTCHPAEYGGLPGNLGELDGFWDYAIIRLNEAPGVERRWANPDTGIRVPGEESNFVLFQHAQAQSLKLDQASIANILPPNPAYVPRFRFVHKANTLDGSSGGPCFDQNFTLFGLHQGEWGHINGLGVLNRGVPLGPIVQHFKAANPQGLPPPDPELIPIWEIVQNNLRVPVIGLDSFQSVCWRLATLGGPKIVTIYGNRGCGKTFATSVLSSMLPEGGHLKVILNALSIGKKDVLQLVKEICDSAGVVMPTIKTAAEEKLTQPAWLKTVIVPALLNAIESVRRGRLVWIMLTELNLATIEGVGASDFLFMLYEQVLTTDWLRIVLDDIQTDLTDSLNGVTERHRLKEQVPESIEKFIRRFFATLSEPIGSVVVAACRETYAQKYDDFMGRNSADAIKRLALDMIQFTRNFRQADE